jgi:MFS family permease
MTIKFRDGLEKKVFYIYLAHYIIEGMIRGVLILNEYVFLKSMGGDDWQLGLLFQFSTVVLVFSLLIDEIIKRIDKKKILKTIALISRLPLFLMLFFPSAVGDAENKWIYHTAFLAIFFLFYTYQPVVMPIVNQYLKKGFAKENFGKFFGYASSANKVVMLLSTLLTGMLFDAYPDSYKYIYPIIGILGLASIYILTLIKIDLPIIDLAELSIFRKFINSTKSIFDVFKRNKAFRDFEIGFMLYGIAFMITYPVIALFFVDVLNLNYSSIGLYKTGYNVVAIIILPFMGILMDRIDPRKFAMITFGSLMIEILFLALAEYMPQSFQIFNFSMPYILIVAMLFSGSFAATMSLLWFVGSAYFSKDETAGRNQSIHLTMVGFRAMFAPLFGVAILELIGYTWVFGISALILLASVSYVGISMKRHLVGVD